MVYVKRKVLYPFFIVVFTVIFFSVLYMVFIYQPVSFINPRITLNGNHFDMTMVVRNNSNHAITDVNFLIDLGGEQSVAPLNACNCLAPKEDVNVLIKLAFPKERLYYDVQLVSPFMRPARLIVPIEQSMIHPVEANVFMDTNNFVVGRTYKIRVDLKNVSKENLYDVSWSKESEGGFFKDDSIPVSVNLLLGESQSLYLTLTPISPGTTKVTFVLKIGNLEERFEQTVKISPVQ